jgi:hypothetical protein
MTAGSMVSSLPSDLWVVTSNPVRVKGGSFKVMKTSPGGVV